MYGFAILFSELLALTGHICISLSQKGHIFSLISCIPQSISPKRAIHALIHRF